MKKIFNFFVAYINQIDKTFIYFSSKGFGTKSFCGKPQIVHFYWNEIEQISSWQSDFFCTTLIITGNNKKIIIDENMVNWDRFIHCLEIKCEDFDIKSLEQSKLSFDAPMIVYRKKNSN